jgi:hypothetical protein
VQLRIRISLILIALTFGMLPGSVRAASITSGALTMDFDAAAFASLAGGSPFPGFELLVLDEHFDQTEAATRDRDAILADEVDASPSTTGLVYGVNGTSVTNLAGRSSQPSNFTFDPSDVLATSVGSIGLGGVDRWRVNPLVGGGVFVIGDLSLSYDSSRASGTTSGWVLYNHFDLSVPAYDLANVSLVAGIDFLSLSGDVLISPELALLFLNSPADAGRDVGNFNLVGTPEPSTAVLMSLGLGAMSALGRRGARTTSRSH